MGQTFGVDNPSQFKAYEVVYVGGHGIFVSEILFKVVPRIAVDIVKIEHITLSLQKKSKNIASKITCI